MRLENSFILVPGIGQKTEQKLWDSGIHHWKDAFESSKVSEGKTEFLQKAQNNLEVGNSRFFGSKLPNSEIWRMYENFQDSICFYDIETTGLSKEKNRVTTVSFHRNGESKTLVRGEDLTRENLKEEIFESSAFVTFNGKRFDQPFLEHNFNVEFDKPHIDLMYTCQKLGLSGGLKPIEKELDVDRELEDLDGREAVRLWKQYEENGDREALRKLVEYNQYDARNLQQVIEIVKQRLTPDRFAGREKP